MKYSNARRREKRKLRRLISNARTADRPYYPEFTPEQEHLIELFKKAHRGNAEYALLFGESCFKGEIRLKSTPCDFKDFPDKSK